MQLQKPAQPATVRVKVLRSFQNHRREILEKGHEATLPRLFALEMQAANKVEFVKEPQPAPATESKPANNGKDMDGKKGERK